MLSRRVFLKCTYSNVVQHWTTQQIQSSTEVRLNEAIKLTDQSLTVPGIVGSDCHVIAG